MGGSLQPAAPREGRYRGELYDLGFDKPETHVVEQGGALHFAFYADRWDGPVTLRGLAAGRWTLRDSLTGKSLGVVNADKPTLPVRFTHSLLIQARPDTADTLPVAFAGKVSGVATDGFSARLAMVRCARHLLPP